MGLAKSFAIVPLISVSLPLGPLGAIEVKTEPTPQVVLSRQINTKVAGILAFNKSENQVAITKALQERAMDQSRAKAIDTYFKERSMPLEGYGAKFVEVAKDNDLDWRLLPAISVIETSGGKNLCKSLPRSKKWNPFGWGSCKIGFESFDKAIETVGHHLGGSHPNTDQHYADKSIVDILDAYNPPSIRPDYKDLVMGVMKRLGEEDHGEIEIPETIRA